MYLTGSNSFGATGSQLNGGVSLSTIMHLNFDAAHKYACIEDIVCDYCNGGGCLNMENNFFTTWREVQGALFVQYTVHG